MGPVLFLMLVVAGVVFAYIIDKRAIQPRNDEIKMLNGRILVEMLKQSETYAGIRNGQEFPHPRPDDWYSHNSHHVEQLGAGGDGEEVLRLRSGRKM